MLRQSHLYRNCPDNFDRTSAEDSKIMIATGEDDTAYDDVYNSDVYLIRQRRLLQTVVYVINYDCPLVYGFFWI